MPGRRLACPCLLIVEKQIQQQIERLMSKQQQEEAGNGCQQVTQLNSQATEYFAGEEPGEVAPFKAPKQREQGKKDPGSQPGEEEARPEVVGPAHAKHIISVQQRGLGDPIRGPGVNRGT